MVDVSHSQPPAKSNLGLIIGIAFAGAILLMLIVGVSSYLSAATYGATVEEAIDAEVRTNQTQYSQFTQTAIETLGVADKYAGKVSEVIEKAIQGRFGENGSQAMVQAFNEAYPASLNDGMYMKVMNIIEAGRRDFAAEQNQLTSKVQGYRTSLRTPWRGMWLAYAGFPTIDLKDPKYNPVISAKADKAFKTGVDEGLQLK